jgi:hypothetical protein
VAGRPSENGQCYHCERRFEAGALLYRPVFRRGAEAGTETFSQLPDGEIWICAACVNEQGTPFHAHPTGGKRAAMVRHRLGSNPVRRVGTNRYQQQVLDFLTERQAMTEAQAQVERRLKRGYVEVPTGG